MKKAIFLFIIYSIIYGNAFTQDFTFPPRNEISEDTSLVTFVNQLQKTVETRDTQKILSFLSVGILNSFGGDGGKEEFVMMWQPDSPESKVWELMDKLINMGGAFMDQSKSEFVFPYVFKANDPTGQIGPFELLVTTGNHVNVRSLPSLKGKVLGQLNYDMVEMDYDKTFPIDDHIENRVDWYYIITLDQKLEGYVFSKYLWSPVDMRMFLSKNNGVWKVNALVGGD